MTAAELLAPLRDGYEPLLETLRHLAWSDDEVRALWLHGSVVKGLADRESDLDLIVTVADDSAGAFGGRLAEWISAAAPMVFTKLLFGRVLIALTADLLRVDVIVEAVADVPRATDRHRYLVFEKEPVAALLPTPDAPRGPDRSVMETLINDFVGELAMMTGVVHREDWVFELESVHRSRTMLHQMLMEANRPLPPYGEGDRAPREPRVRAARSPEDLADCSSPAARR